MNTRITELRENLGLTKTEFGKKLGIKPSSVFDIENGNCKITDRVIITICAIFHVNEEWLRTGNGEMFIEDTRKLDEFLESFNKVNEPLQDYLVQCAKNLLDAQNKM